MRIWILICLLTGCRQTPAPPKISPPTRDTVSTYHHFIFHGAKPDSADFRQQSQIMDEAVNKFLRFIQKPNEKLQITVEVYPSYEQKALQLGNQSCGQTIAPNKIAVVWSKDALYKCLDGSNSVESLLSSQIGQPKVSVLGKGFSTYFTKAWRFKGFQHWAAKIHQAGFTPDLQTLLQIQSEVNPFYDRMYRHSPLIQQALLGAFVDFMIQKEGNEQFIKRLLEDKLQDLDVLEADFRSYLAQLPTQGTSPIPNPPALQKGFNFAHEGYNVVDGYMGSSALQSLDKMQQLGVNATAIVPYSFMRRPDVPMPFAIPQGKGGENDESVIFSMMEARKRGMVVMLKPQIWLPDSWPGAVAFNKKEDAESFFKYYTEWIAHYALLAEMYDVDIFCVATEFGKMTKDYEEKWIDLFGKIRKVYRGKLTVAAHWQGDFEHKPFWDALDYVGINLYKSLSEKPDATDAELESGALALANLMKTQAERFGKPVILTETGFTATDGCWKNPFEYADGKTLNVEHQKRAYSAFLKAMIQEKAVVGMYLWKYPTFLRYGGLQNNDFTPNGKPAENVISDWFHQWKP